MAEQLISASGPQFGAIVTSGGRLLVDLDRVAVYEDSLVVMDSENYRLKIGESFQAGSSFYRMLTDGSAALYIAVGSLETHIKMGARSDGDIRMIFMEDTDVSNSGTALNIFNQQRDSLNTINTKLFVNPTINVVTGSGDVIQTALMIGGSGLDTRTFGAPFFLGRGDTSWQLKSGTAYWIKFENVAGRDTSIDWDIGLHEHD